VVKEEALVSIVIISWCDFNGPSRSQVSVLVGMVLSTLFSVH
jgi:hypothetical protein